MERREPIKKIYEKEKDEEIFQWFEEEGLTFLKQRCGEEAKISWEKEEEGIRVTIKLKKILILADFDKELLDFLGKSATCTVEVGDQGWLMIQFWFRGWVWTRTDENG